MALVQPFAGATEPDVAQLEASGAVYRLFAWSTGTQVRARCYVIHEQGQESLLFDNVVATAAANHTFDSVRCVHAADQYLVVLWLDRNTSAGTYELDGAWVDVENSDTVSTWTGMAAVTIDDAGLYDAKQVENAVGTSEYMLAYATSTTVVRVRRVTGSIIGTFSWSTDVTTNHADRILGVHGDASVANNDGGVCIVFQGTGAASNDLEMEVLDYNDGSDLGTLNVYTGITAEYGAVGICRTTLAAAPTTPVVAVIAEFHNEDITDLPGAYPANTFMRWIVCREVNISSFAGALGNAHVTANLNMMSKPYSYTDAEGDRHVYCGLAYKASRFNSDWLEFAGLICDMGLQHWGAATSTIRPRHVATYHNLNINAACHGSNPESSGRIFAGTDIGRRMNHLSNWVDGPFWLCDIRKSRTVAWPGWSRVDFVAAFDGGNAAGPRPEPTGATVEEIVHYLEDPWTVNRDPLDHTQPTLNYHGSNPLSLYSNAEVQDELLIAGGTPCLYDGAAIVELGFPWTPEIVDVSVDTGGTRIFAGDYRYVAVYEWRDTRGQLHRSGPSNVVSYTAVGSVDGALVTVRTMTIGSKEAAWLYPNAASIVIAVYRTLPTAGYDSSFFRLHSTEAIAGFTPADIPTNIPTMWAITITDNVNDLDLCDSDGIPTAPQLNYLDGGDGVIAELAPMTPPAAHLVFNWRNRAWLVASEEKELWPSKENLPTAFGRIAPEFNTDLRFLLDSVRGDVTGVQVMDDEAILFTRDGIYALTGDAASGAGLNFVVGTLALQVLHEGTGCIEPRSLALTPAGILFQSYKGMYLLDKGKGLDFISTGAPIEDLIRTAGNVRSGHVLDDRHLVAFTANDAVTDGPIVIKYDYYHRMWSTAKLEPPNTTAWLSSTASGCTWRCNERDLSHVVLCQGNLLVERGKDDQTPYREETDAGATQPVLVDLETGWVHFAGIAGHIRTWEIGVQLGTHDITSNVYAEIDTERDGEYSTSTPLAHRFGTPYQSTLHGYLPIKPRVQRMTAFRLRIHEPNVAAAEAALQINGFTAKIGVQRGLRPNTSANRGVIP